MWVLLLGGWVLGAATIGASIMTRRLTLGICWAAAGLLGAIFVLVAITSSSAGLTPLTAKSGAAGRMGLAVAGTFLTLIAIAAGHCRVVLGRRVAPIVQSAVSGVAAVLALVGLILSLTDLSGLKNADWKAVLMVVLLLCMQASVLAGLVVSCIAGLRPGTKLSWVGLLLVYAGLGGACLVLLVCTPLFAESLTVFLLILNMMSLTVGPMALLVAGAVAIITLLVLRYRAQAPSVAPAAEPVHTGAASPAPPVEVRLARLDSLLAENRITQEEYATARSRILAEL
jgi:hypothetical protein